MTEEEGQSLNECNLQKQKREADGSEVDDQTNERLPARCRRAALVHPEQWKHDQYDRREQCLDQSGDQNEVTPLDQRNAAASAKSQKLGKRAPLEEVEEIWPFVGGRTDEELIAFEEIIANSLSAEKSGSRIKDIRVVENVVSIGLRSHQPGRVINIE